MKRVLIKDVAALAGASPATVSKVLNDVPDSGIPEETAERVRWAARKLRYVPLSSARSLRRQRTDTVALIAHDITPFTAEIVRGVEASASQHNFSTVLALHGGDIELEAKHLQMGLRGQVDGLIVVPARGRHNLDLYNDLKERRVPFVFVDRYIPDYPADYVGTKNEEAAYKLTRTIIAQGADVIGSMFGAKGNTALDERRVGFHRALQEVGLPYEESSLPEADQLAQEQLLERWLARRPRINGLFWSSYQYIQPHLAILAAHSVRVPEDIRFAGFDPVSLTLSRLEHYQALQIIHGPWPAAIQPGYEMGHQAFEIVVRALGGQHEQGEQRILLEPRYEWLAEPQMPLRP